jgi:hypothetical protein
MKTKRWSGTEDGQGREGNCVMFKFFQTYVDLDIC